MKRIAIKNIKRDAVPIRFRFYQNYCETLFEFISVDNDNPNAYVEEKQMCGHMGRILTHKENNGWLGEVTVERDDGTVWTVRLDNFEEYRKVKLI